MMAKITKGSSFGGCVKYVMEKKGAQLIGAKDVLYANRNTISESFNTQSDMNPRLGKKIGHISLNFPAQDKDKIDNAFMLKVAGEYMQRMGIMDTQSIIVRHNDRDHPHCHIVFNRVSNSGKTISDQNDRVRSVKACKALTQKYGLYMAPGKENVKREQLRDPDKVKYEIYDAVKAALPLCFDWSELEKRLKKNGIAITYKFKGTTEQKEGVIFSKDGQSFNGSKVDRQFSYSKIDTVLNDNARKKEISENRRNPQGVTRQPSVLPDRNEDYYQPGQHNNHSPITGIGNLFDVGPSGYDENEAEFLRQQRKKKKKRGRSM